MPASDATRWPVRAAQLEAIEFFMFVPIGATGAVGTVRKSAGQAPELGISRSSTGTYALTYPAGKDVFIDAQLLAADATPTAASIITTAESPTAGTATLVAVNGTAAAEIESGSTLKLRITVFALEALA